MDDALFAINDSFNGAIIRQHCHHDVALSRLRWSVDKRRSCPDKGICPTWSAIPDLKVVAGCKEIARHGATHSA